MVVVSPPRGIHVPRQIRIDLAIVIVLEYVVHYIASRTGQGRAGQRNGLACVV